MRHPHNDLEKHGTYQGPQKQHAQEEAYQLLDTAIAALAKSRKYEVVITYLEVDRVVDAWEKFKEGR